MTASPDLRRRRSRRDRALLILAGLLLAAFLVAFAARPAIVLSTGDMDDALFMRLGQSLADGKWLGHYDELTLVKGIGFPVFLALTNLSGLPFTLAIALVHAAASAFAAAVVRRLTGSLVAAVALLAALLLLPTLYEGELMRVFREVFYMSMSLAFVTAAVALVTGCVGGPRQMALLAGVLGGWVWLTREEGVWLFPCIILLALVPLTGDQTAAPPAPWRARLRRLAPAGLALAIGVAIVMAVGLANWAAYGRFVVNEIKDGAFQSAMSALQDASAPYHREGIPVPAAARARIYAVSPAFASIKGPVMDGPLEDDATHWGCLENPKFCHDFGGGWFMWVLRGSAAAHGEHASASKAAAFYRTLARQVRQACVDGRLKCEHWAVPMVPPMRTSELADVGRSLAKEAKVLTFGERVNPYERPSDLSAAGADAELAFLNRPAFVPAVVDRKLNGWFIAKGPQWFALQAAAPVRIVAFTRQDSPDLVTHFHDPSLQRQRFALDVVCPAQAPCPATLVVDGGQSAPIDLASLDAGEHKLAGATMYLDHAMGNQDAATLKGRFSAAWVKLASHLSPLYRGVVALGVVAYLALLARAALRRRISALLLICTAMLASVGARGVILALIDALSFRAADISYSLAAFPLLLMFSVLAVHDAVAGVFSGRRVAAG